MKVKLYLAALIALFLTKNACLAQKPIRLQKCITQLDSSFQSGTLEEFKKNMPLSDVQEFFSNVLEKKFKRVSGESKILRVYKDSAYVLLSGLLLYGNSGDETRYSDNYTGVYKFEQVKGIWKLKERISIDRLNKIDKQNLNVNVLPGYNIKVRDTLTLAIQDPIGFAVKLNHSAKLSSVFINGVKANFTFTSGLLWVDAKPKKDQKLVIDYTIAVEKDEKDRNSGYFGDTFGHLRNQYFWHPFYDFSNPNDRAQFTLYCTIPQEYHLSTSLPQKDSVVDGLRIITAKSENRTFALSLYYDKEWEKTTFKKDQINMVIYATKDFKPEKDSVFMAFSKNYDTLKKYFGNPRANYLAIVQDRAAGSGWKNRSNNIIVAGANGSILITNQPVPRAYFGHEVAHAWTSPTGPATNFLTEGWATYTESILLAGKYGNSIVPTFFNTQKANFIGDEFDGNQSLWEDYGNSGVSYSKGSWLFYMLENQIGREKLFLAISNFTRSKDQSIGSFIDQLTAVTGVNMKLYMLSWLKSKEIPALIIKRSGSKLIIRQEKDIFIFPLEVKVKLKDGSLQDKVIDVNSREHTIDLGSDIEACAIDPSHKLLITIKS